MSKSKFASRVRLVSETGRDVCFVHAEEAERLYRNGQAIRRNPGKLIRELVLPDSQPMTVSDHISCNSCRSVYGETLAGGSQIVIEPAKTLAREVTTQPCRLYKMKTIRPSLRPMYETIVRENLTPFRREYDVSRVPQSEAPQFRPIRQ
jgi:hypothetical protein